MRRLLGLAGLHQGTHHGNRAHAGAQNLAKLRRTNAANGHQWVALHQPHIGGQTGHPLRRGGHFFQRRREHSAQGDVAGGDGVGTQHFGVAVRAHAQAQARGAQLGQGGGGQGIEVFLPQMHAVSPRLHGLAPMVVDEQQRPGAAHGGHGGTHFVGNRGGVFAFAAQLHRGHTCTRHAAHPGSIGQHGVQAQVLGAGGKSVAAVAPLHAKIARVAGPAAGVEVAQALALVHPGAGQGMGIGGNKAQGGAGLQGGAVPRFMQRFAGRFAQGRGGRDGLRHPICH